MAGPAGAQEERRRGQERSPLLEALERKEERREGLPAPDAVAALATPAILRALDHPDLKAPANATVGAAIWRELVLREGEGFARNAMARRGLAPDEEHGERRKGAGGRRISAAPPPREQAKDAAAVTQASAGGVRAEAPGRETPAKAAAADADGQVKRRVVEEGLAQERGADANGHVAYWVSDAAEVVQGERGWGVQMRALDLHTRIHVRDPGDPNFSAIEDFGPYYGGAFDLAFVEFTGVVLHEQTHVEEIRGVWAALWPEFRARVEAVAASSPGGAEAEYRTLFEEFDEALFAQYFASGEVGARAKEWEHYHRLYDRQVGRPEGVAGGPGAARAAGARQGGKETVAAQEKAGLKQAAGAGRPAKLDADGAPKGKDPVRRVSSDITGAFESGADGASAINDYDSGVISYGIHQATLTSGSLETVLRKYVEAKGQYAAEIGRYMGRVRSKDGSLRGDKAFKDLLRRAGKDPVMVEVQSEAFATGYYTAAEKAANDFGLKSPLGVSMLYDTNIQGGMGTLLKRTVKILGGKAGDKGVTETQFLKKFNDLRRKRLLLLAAEAARRGDRASAEALHGSTARCDEFAALLAVGNLNLLGPLVVRGTAVEGLVEADLKGAVPQDDGIA